MARQPAEVFPVREYILDELAARSMTVDQMPAMLRRFMQTADPLRQIDAQVLSALFATSSEFWMRLDAADRGAA